MIVVLPSYISQLYLCKPTSCVSLPVAPGNATETQYADFCILVCLKFNQITVCEFATHHGEQMQRVGSNGSNNPYDGDCLMLCDHKPYPFMGCACVGVERIDKVAYL